MPSYVLTAIIRPETMLKQMRTYAWLCLRSAYVWLLWMWVLWMLYHSIILSDLVKIKPPGVFKHHFCFEIYLNPNLPFCMLKCCVRFVRFVCGVIPMNALAPFIMCAAILSAFWVFFNDGRGATVEFFSPHKNSPVANRIPVEFLWEFLCKYNMFLRILGEFLWEFWGYCRK